MKGMMSQLKTPLIFSLLGLALICSPAAPQGSQAAQTATPNQEKAAPQTPPPSENIPQSFGYDLFKASTEPISEGPVDENYIISPGDEIIIQTWGQLTLLHSLTVTEEGYLDLPDAAGRIYTNGVTLKDLKAEVTKSLSQIYAAYINAADPSKSSAFVDVKLGKIRKLLIYAVGEVIKPGAYTLTSGTATIVNLLLNAGGVKETGSLREIRIRRAGGKTENFDLYDFLLSGKLDVRKSQLRSGDYVIVPLKQKTVSIKGEVRRPMQYELVGNEGVRELVSFAGGFTPDAYLSRTQLKRFEINRGETYLDLDLDNLGRNPNWDFVLEDRDNLTIPRNIQVRKNEVEISGSGVVRPGTYEFTPGMTLKDLIDKADGLREYVYLDRADLVRTEADFSKKLTPFSLRDLYREEKPGIYQFIGSREKNFALNEMDQVSIYSAYGMRGEEKHIRIVGQVNDPGEYVLARNMTLFDLVFAHGGFQNPDFKRTVYLDLGHVIRKVSGLIGQKLIPFNLGKLLDGDPAANFILEDGDLVRIYSNAQMTIKSTVQISGLVNKPGTYDLSENLTVEDLIVLAGGLKAEAYKPEAVVARSEATGEGKTETQRREATFRALVEPGYAVLPIEKKTPLKAFDRVTVRNLPGWEPLPGVSLTGEVLYPGDYSLESREERISNLIRRAGGLRPEALPEGAVIRRNKNILAMVPGESAQTVEITLNLADALRRPGGQSDLVLKDGDVIFIPNNPGTVEVKGAVRMPLILQHQEDKGVQDYINLCGGYLESADKSGVVVYAANNEARKISRGLFARSNPSVSPGSTIEIPFKGETTKLETVKITGAVVKPAVFQYIQGAKLGYYLDLCGGYSKVADPEKVVIHLADGGLLSKKKGVAFNPVIPAESIVVVMEVPGVPGLAATEKTEEKVVAEKPEERKEVVVKQDPVIVKGAVAKPAIVPYIKDALLGYYLESCKGLTETADPDNITIMLPDGTLMVKQENVPFNPVIPPGSIITVNEKSKTAGQ